MHWEWCPKFLITLLVVDRVLAHELSLLICRQLRLTDDPRVSVGYLVDLVECSITVLGEDLVKAITTS